MDTNVEQFSVQSYDIKIYTVAGSSRRTYPQISNVGGMELARLNFLSGWTAPMIVLWYNFAHHPKLIWSEQHNGN